MNAVRADFASKLQVRTDEHKDAARAGDGQEPPNKRFAPVRLIIPDDDGRSRRQRPGDKLWLRRSGGVRHDGEGKWRDRGAASFEGAGGGC